MKSAKKERARQLSTQELAAEYGVHESTVRRWPSQGCPARRRGKRHSFDPAAVEAWLEQMALDDRELAAALTRKIDAQSRREARILGELAESHVLRAEAELAWSKECERIRARLSRIPSEFAPEIAGALRDGGGEPEIAFLLGSHAHAVLEDLADVSDLPPPLPRPPIPVRVSDSVRQARAQFANLQAAVLDVRERIAAGAHR